MPTLKECWSQIIQAEDYELHMANIGQAQANAVLVRDLIIAAEIPPDSRVVFAGAGPGQMFDHVDGAFLKPFEVVFTDINEAFLARLSDRAQKAGLTRFATAIDDIECSGLEGPVAAVVLVLVLEHVDWRKALESMTRWDPSRFIMIVQRNPPEMASMVAPNRELPGTLKVASEGEKSCLMDQAELIDAMGSLGFGLARSESRPVPDGKEMCGLIFHKKGR